MHTQVKHLKPTIQTILSLMLLIGIASPPLHAEYAQRVDVKAYIEELVNKHKLDRAIVVDTFQKARKQTIALKLMERPAEAKPWHEYRELFVTPQRIEQGVNFWFQHQDLLKKINKQYAVPTEIILSIVGVETIYGRNTGRLHAFDTLITLAFDYPRRADFFRKELSNLFLLLKEEGYKDYSDIRGSYAGALGLGQFIPSSYREYAVDFDGDGKRDLWNSMPDGLASVANYLIRHGWKVGEPITEPVTVVVPNKLSLEANNTFKPMLYYKDAKALGFVATDAIRQGMPYALFSFEVHPQHHQYWVGYNNFYAITRYNHSRRYALAVYQLGQAIRQQYRSKGGKS